ncbi:MAG: transposase [Deltaproteobacteria bacterium]|jgi:hypothetical protein|nr:transposase [Deltaproteobacteria bacterium]
MNSEFADIIAKVNSLPKPLSGFIVYQNKHDKYFYGLWYKNTYAAEGKVCHDSLYLGRVVNKEQGLFYKKDYGLFTFSTEHGFGKPPEIITNPSEIIGNSSIHNSAKRQTVPFGDVWMIDQVCKQIGLDKVIEDLLPEAAATDTLKALVAYRLIKNDAYCYAKDWYEDSFANILYPQAQLDSPRISEFMFTLGQDVVRRKFFTSYFETVINRDSIHDQITMPVLIDSTGLPNNNQSHLTATNCHNGKVSREIRLAYVVDKNTKLPIFFQFISGNIIDNTTLIRIINTLQAYSISIDLIIMDAGYHTEENLKQLLEHNINFITRMPINRRLYKELMEKHGATLDNVKNSITYQDRALCGVKDSITIYGKKLLAYIMLDLNKQSIDKSKAIFKYADKDNKEEQIEKEYESAGKFILLSSLEYEISEILPLYYTRQAIEQIFDVSKTYCDILPLRGHSDESLNGIVLIAFMATVIYSSINYKLVATKFSAHAALIKLGHFKIDIYESCKILDNITKEQRDLFVYLNLENPLIYENGTCLEKKPLFNIKSQSKKRGRHKGSKNKTTEWLNIYNHKPEGIRKKGRPKGSKNKVKKELTTKNSRNYDGSCRRGRPKGSKNKEKHDKLIN